MNKEIREDMYSVFDKFLIVNNLMIKIRKKELILMCDDVDDAIEELTRTYNAASDSVKNSLSVSFSSNNIPEALIVGNIKFTNKLLDSFLEKLSNIQFQHF